MKRLTVKKVMAAYQKIGLAPCNRLDEKYDDDRKTVIACCPAIAVARAGNGDCWYDLEKAGYNEEYLAGFSAGVDSPSMQHHDEEADRNWRKGCEDGKVAWAAVKPLAKRSKNK